MEQSSPPELKSHNNMNKCSVVLKGTSWSHADSYSNNHLPVINASGISIKSVVKRKPRSSVRIRVNKDRVYETTTTDTDVPVWNKEFKMCVRLSWNGID